jgi:uncharacterized protein involved in exopolysaccharide biosynthesis/Mrp family chromosome partitioning ATPase
MEYTDSSVSVETDGITIADLVKIVIQKFPHICIVTILSLIAAYAYVQTTVKEYQSSVTLMVHPIKQSTTIGKVLSSDFFDTSKDIATEVQLITNVTTLRMAARSLDLSSYVREDGETYENPGVLGDLRSKVTVTTVKSTNIVEITVRDPHPVFAADYANALAHTFNLRLAEFAQESKRGQLEFLNTQIPKIDEQLQQASDTLYEYKFRTKIDFLSHNATTLIDHIAYLNTKIKPLSLQILKNKAFLRDSYGMEVGAMEDQALISALSSYETIYEELILYEIVSNRSTAGSQVANNEKNTTMQPRVAELSNQMQEWRREVFKIVSFQMKGGKEDISRAITEIVLAEAEIHTIGTIIELLEQECNQLPLLQKELSRLVGEVNSYEDIRKELHSYREQISLTVAAEGNNVKVVSLAAIPSRPVSPNVLLIYAVSLLLGGALGLLLALFLSLRDTSLYSFEDLQSVLGSEVSVLGWIPLKKKRSNDELSLVRDAVEQHSCLALQYKKTAAHLVHGRNKGHALFAISSSIIGEAKSTSTIYLGVCLEQMGYTVLLVDADFLRPSLSEMLDLPVEQSIARVSDETPNLHIASSRFTKLMCKSAIDYKALNELKREYDYILVDIPPLQYASEQMGLIDACDTLLMCIRMNVCKKEDIINFLYHVKEIKKPVGGVIATACTTSNLSYYAKQYKQYYNQYTHCVSKDLCSSKSYAKKIYRRDLARKKRCSS